MSEDLAIVAAYNGVTKELKKRGLRFERDPEVTWRSIAFVEKEYLTVDIKPERSASGKIRISVGNYGSRKQFPSRTKGFDFVAIVDEVQRQLKGIWEKRYPRRKR